MVDASSLLAVVFLISLSALFSGLTLGLMGLDQMGLKVLIESGARQEASPQEKQDAKFARAIQPFRSRGNLLLCTLLFGNVAVNSMLSILMADMTSGMAGFLISTITIVIFGEILPQSLCSRHALKIGSACIPLVYLFVVLTFIASYPTSLLLDHVLGEEMGTIYSRNQLKALFNMYTKMRQLTGFEDEDGKMIEGVLSYSEKTIKNLLTPIDQVYMLSVTDRLTWDTMKEIWKRGHSRVPVYQMVEGESGRVEQKIIGLLFVKDLILLDPDDATPVEFLCHRRFALNDLPIVYEDGLSRDVMKVFKSGQSHMALVQRLVTDGDGDPYRVTTGIVTLEDLIEDILQDQIYDEGDRQAQDSENGGGGVQVSLDHAKTFTRTRSQQQTHPIWQLIEEKEALDEALPAGEVDRITKFLQTNYPAPFSDAVISATHLASLVSSSRLLSLPELQNHDLEHPEPQACLYTRGTGTTTCTLVLEGHVSVRSGEEDFESGRGPWSLFCLRVLSFRNEIVSDFSAVVDRSRPARLLQIRLSDYLKRLNEPQAPRSGFRTPGATASRNTSPATSQRWPASNKTLAPLCSSHLLHRGHNEVEMSPRPTSNSGSASNSGSLHGGRAAGGVFGGGRGGGRGAGGSSRRVVVATEESEEMEGAALRDHDVLQTEASDARRGGPFG